MICRIWHGWTTPENADAYERLLRSEIFHGITERGIAGYGGIELLRRAGADEVEFVTIMWFDSLEAVRYSIALTHDPRTTKCGRHGTRESR